MGSAELSWRPPERRKPGHGLTTHGRTYDPIYRTWCEMFRRCYNPKFKDWHLYGGKGIRVCRRWHRFENFLADMGERPSLMHTLDRKNSARGYSPSNCRWATPKEQANNTTRNVWLTYKGQRKTVAQWAAIIGIGLRTLHRRVKEGWSIEKVLNKPASNNGENSPHARLTERDVRAIRRSKESSLALAKRYPITARTIRRIRSGERWKSINA